MNADSIKLGFAFTGSFCTMRTATDVLRSVKEKGYDVYPIMSETVCSTDTRFGKCKDFKDEIEEITGRKIICTIEGAEPIGPKKLIDALLELKPKKIVYISCNPSTMARDIKLLKDSYKVESVQPVDLFPRTHHVECVVRMSRTEHSSI